MRILSEVRRRERIKRIIILIALLGGGAVSLSYFGPKIRKEEAPKAVRNVEEKIKETGFGKTVLKILGAETEKEEEKKKEEKERESIVENFKEKIEKVIIEKSSEKIIEILKTLPPEEFEELKGEFCPKFCRPE